MTEGARSRSLPDLPAGWGWRALNEMVRTSSGGTPSRRKPEFYENGTIPWLKIGDLNDGIVTAAGEHITEGAVASSSAKLLPAGTLLVAMYGSIGKLGTIAMEATTNQAICALETDDPILRRFLYWYLRFMRSRLLADGYGGTQANISQGYLKQLPVPVPPRDVASATVRAIEGHLIAVDEGDGRLAAAMRLATSYRAACLEAAFAGRLVAFNVESTELADVAVIQSGLTKGRVTSDATTDVAYIRTANVQAGFLDLSEIKTMRVTDVQRARHKLENGDVLVLEGGDADKVGRGWIWEAQLAECLHQNHVFAVRPDSDRLLPRFLAYYLNAPSARRYFLSVAKQTTNLASINKKNLSALPIPVPRIETQKQVIDRLDSQLGGLADLQRQLRTRRDDAARLRQAVLERAFSGRLALPAGDPKPEADDGLARGVG